MVKPVGIDGVAVAILVGDVIDVPGRGDMVVGAITALRTGRFSIRLDKKFEESITLELVYRK